MRKNLRIRIRFILLALSLCSFPFVSYAEALSTVFARCVSDSGLSIYDVELNLKSYDGELRYRFMGQDIFYKATIEEITEASIKGVAVFDSSRSGETKGKPFSFVYDLQENTLTELNVNNCTRDDSI
jgi:intein/homing endonuclease